MIHTKLLFYIIDAKYIEAFAEIYIQYSTNTVDIDKILTISS